MSETIDDNIPSSDSSGANSAASGEGYIADFSEGANSTDSGYISMTNGEGDAALEEVLNKSKLEWLYSEDVAHLYNLPSDLTLTKQTIQFYQQDLYLFHKWMTPDEYEWDAISELHCTRDLNRLYYTVAKKRIGPFAMST